MTDIRTLTLSEVQTLIDWAAAEGWNPGLHDASCFHAADPEGFFGAFIDGHMAAGIAAVAYDDQFGFIGLYICHPAYRGRGLGRAVWDAAMAYLGDRIIGLDGVPEQQANYLRMGFKPAGQTVRWRGKLPHAKRDGIVRPVRNPAEIEQLDRRCFPAHRPAFLRGWLQPPHEALLLEDAGQAAGWAVKRPCRDGAKIGPLFATDTEIAVRLLESFSGPVTVDVPETQLQFASALERRGFVPGFRTARMYRGPAPGLELGMIYGISSLELG